MRSMWIAGVLMAVAGQALAGPAWAGESVSCDKAVNTFDLNACAERAFEADDAALNAAYRKALDAIAKHDAPAPYDRKAYEAAFRAAQRAWVAYRDGACKGVVPFGWGGGTGTTAAVLGCLSEKTKVQTQEISDMLAER